MALYSKLNVNGICFVNENDCSTEQQCNFRKKKIFFVKSTAFYTQFIFQRDFLRENDDGKTKTFFSPSRFFS